MAKLADIDAKDGGQGAGEIALIGSSRRQFLQGSLAVAGAAVAADSPLEAVAAQTRPKRPNFVFFFGEGQRADASSLAGNRIVATPDHDRIGREGVRFRNAFCTNALCAPARASTLTGMYSKSTGALSNEHLKVPLPSDIPLVTDILQANGYEVAIVGKVHVRNGVEERKWDYYFGHNDPANDYVNPFFKEGRNGRVGPEQRFHNVYSDDLAVDRAIEWLKQDRGDKPSAFWSGLLRRTSPSSTRVVISIFITAFLSLSPQPSMTT